MERSGRWPAIGGQWVTGSAPAAEYAHRLVAPGHRAREGRGRESTPRKSTSCRRHADASTILYFGDPASRGSPSCRLHEGLRGRKRFARRAGCSPRKTEHTCTAYFGANLGSGHAGVCAQRWVGIRARTRRIGIRARSSLSRLWSCSCPRRASFTMLTYFALVLSPAAGGAGAGPAARRPPGRLTHGRAQRLLGAWHLLGCVRAHDGTRPERPA